MAVTSNPQCATHKQSHQTVFDMANHM